MTNEILKAIPVFFSSALKFIFGPLEGYGLHLHFITTIVATVGGMMLSVVAFTYFGDWLRKGILKRFFQNKERKTPTRRTAVLIRKYGLAGVAFLTRTAVLIRKYGLAGVAFLTPLFLTPIGGTIIAVGMGKPKNKIIIFMLISAVGWALVFTSLIYLLGRLDIPEILK